MKRRVLSFIIALVLCLNLCPIRAWAAGEGTDGGLCPHHPSHTDECGYIPESPDAPCTFACRICLVEDLIGQLPDSVSDNNREQVQLQLSEIGALYDGLTVDEQQQVDLSPCVSLQEQLDGISLAALSGDLGGISAGDVYNMTGDVSDSEPRLVSTLLRISTNGHTLTITNSPAIQVNGTGKLYLTGKVTSTTGVGVEVLSGGYLSVTGPDTLISGDTCALNIASGAEVCLSGGKYSGRYAAIQTADNNFAALLEAGCAYFDGSGKLLLPAEAATARIIVIGQCPGHSGKTYTHTPGATTHTWACPYCGVGETEACTFTFDQHGNGTCDLCGNTIAIAVDERGLTDLVYDGTLKPGSVPVTVKLNDGSNEELVKDTDYEVVYEPRTDAGEITVTVTGTTFRGTFTKTYTVAQDKPSLSWADSNPVTVNYDGAPVEAGDLPDVSINIRSQADNLQGYLQYSYRKQGDTDYTGGLPRDAGAYEVIVSLPVLPNFEGAVSDPITLTISPINPIAMAPDAKTPTYNRSPQALVTAGTLDPAAVADGLTIEFAEEKNGAYSAEIPSATNAGDYTVWYQVVGLTNNYIAPDPNPVEIDDVKILRKGITPIVTLSDDTYQYDGGFKEPKVTVRDVDGVTVLLDTEYAVTYTDNRNVGTAKVTVTDKPNGNYELTEVEVEFQITPSTQKTLSITQKPNTITYGDKFTLGTQGGSGSGDVTWKITSGEDVATVDPNSGQVTVIGHGSATVQATKSGLDPVPATRAADGANYEDATASWMFTAVKRPVTATVTAEDKSYDGNDTAIIHAVVEQGVLPGDKIEFVGLAGAFSNENAGVDKTVTVTTGADGKPVDTSGQPVTITGKNSEHYDVSYSSLTVKAAIHKAVANIMAAPSPASLTYDRTAQALLSTGAGLDTQGVLVEYALSEDGPYSTDFPEGINAGKYTVWYRVQETGNYTGLAPAHVEVEIGKKAVTPTVTLSGDGLTVEPDGSYSYIYDGTAKKPDVVVKDGDNVIPVGEYTVSYSSNTAVGTATVTISDAPGGNYTVSGSTIFTIRAATASLKDEPQPNSLTYNGFAQELLKPGTAVNGRVVYSTSATGPFTTSIPTGTNAGTYQVWYKVEGENGATVSGTDADPRPKTVTIQPKQVTPTVLVGGAVSYSTPYTGSPVRPDVAVIVEGKQLNGEYTLSYSNNTNPGTATVTVQNSGGNYQFFAVTTFEITRGKAKFLQEPAGKTNLVYTGEAQELVIMGVSQAGTVVYSLNGGEFYPFVPEGTEVGSYVVMAKVQGNEFLTDSEVKAYRVIIGKNVLEEAEVDVALSANSFQYTGYEQKPPVTVRNTKDNVGISASEYTVTYANNVAVGTASVTVTGTGKNYSFQKTVSFEITAAGQPALTITGKPDTVYYGDTVRLGTTGGSGTVTWTVESGNASSLGDGQFKITGSGRIMVRAATSDSSDTCTLYADPKPVTAVVTAADKPYDASDIATLTVTVSNGLVFGDTISSDDVTATGYFTDANAGTNKTVIITGLTVPDAISAKYNIQIQYPATTTASITPAPAAVTKAPGKAENLTYTSLPQDLVTPGEAANGTMAYSLDGVNYSFNVPKGTDAKTYDVWYKVVAANENYKDSAPVKVSNAAIAANTDTPNVLCTPSKYQYDGTAKTPTVVVQDNSGRIIPKSEYTVTVNSNAPAIAVGQYTVTVTDNQGGNYEFTASPTGTFEIVAASQSPLNVVTDIPSDVHYGDTFRLSATGGSGSGAIKWSIAESSVATINDGGVVTVTGTGAFTVAAYREASDGYSKSDTDKVLFYAWPKPVTPTVTAKSRDYDGTTDATLHAAWKPGDLVGNDTIDLTVTGAFATKDAGINKEVKIQSHTAIGADAGKYTITWPDTTMASIYKVNAELEDAPKAVPGLTYDGSTQLLVTGGRTAGGIGTIVYSLSQNGVYSENIPTGIGAGKYSVWYKVADSVNHTGIDAAVVEVEIAKATPRIDTAPTASGTEGQKLSGITLTGGTARGISNVNIEGTFTWANGDAAAANGVPYDVIFTPDDSANYKTATCQVIAVQSVTNGNSTTNSSNSIPVSRPDSPDTSSTPTRTTIQNGTASTVVSAADGSRLVREAVANQSRNVVIKPEITSDVTKAQVSIPSSTVSRLSSTTDAALTVSSPIADVTISNAALDTLSQAGGSVSVAAEKAEQSVVVTLAAGGKVVEQVPGGLTLTVPAEDAGPGTVAVLVHDDGTREIVRKSVVEDGVMSVPLSGSATVEIVDNSKEFADVPSESWAADAVAFASAHELFSGTSETMFSPDQAMSRGMLATVLYRLDGSPELDLTEAFQDVSSEAWYAEGVAWAVENGIAGGYGGGQFGPDDSITREQFVVMLWRYAGSPESSSQVLDFADADQVNGYAQEALCWAVENGIVHGVGNGMLDPGGKATRAQAAQLLKNFMENT